MFRIRFFPAYIIRIAEYSDYHILFVIIFITCVQATIHFENGACLLSENFSFILCAFIKFDNLCLKLIKKIYYESNKTFIITEKISIFFVNLI